MEQKALQPPNSTREGQLDERTDIYAIGALLYYMGTGHAPEGEIKAGQGSCRGDSVHSYGAMSQDREEKERPPRVCREVLQALEKLEARMLAERHIPLLRIAAAGAAGAESGLHIPHLARSDICGRKEFPAFTGSRMTRGQSAGWHPGMGWRRMNMEFITWTVWR